MSFRYPDLLGYRKEKPTMKPENMARKGQILVIGGAHSTNVLHEWFLREKFVCIVCDTGFEAREVIESGRVFDLVITDIVIPIEDTELTLDDVWTTGIRLIIMMLEKGTCKRFYVCTDQKFKHEVERICHNKAILHFENYFEFEPEEFVDKVSELIGKPINL